jgi:hypothetical protein
MSTSSINQKFDIFISYQWNMKDKVKIFCDKLGKSIENLNIWRDDGQLRSDNSTLPNQLAKAIRYSKIIVCFITKEYGLSKNCMKELNFADKLNKIIMFLLINKIEDVNSDEIQFIMSNNLYINCYKDQEDWLDLTFDNILRNIKDNLKVNKNPNFFFNL